MAVQPWKLLGQKWTSPPKFHRGLLERKFVTPEGEELSFSLFGRDYPFVTSCFGLTKPPSNGLPEVILVRQFRQGPGEAGKILTELPGGIGLTDDEFGKNFPRLSDEQWQIIQAAYTHEEEREFFEAVFGDDFERRIEALIGPDLYQTLRDHGTAADEREFLEIEARVMATAVVELLEETGYVGLPMRYFLPGGRLRRDYCAGRRWSDTNETVLRSWAGLVKCVKVGEPESGCECLTIPVSEFLAMLLNPDCEDWLRTPSAPYALLALGILKFDAFAEMSFAHM